MASALALSHSAWFARMSESSFALSRGLILLQGLELLDLGVGKLEFRSVLQYPRCRAALLRRQWRRHREEAPGDQGEGEESVMPHASFSL